MKSAEAVLSWSLYVECPHCGEKVDLTDQDEEGQFSTPIFNNEGDAIKGMEGHCSYCGDDFEISGVEY